MKTSFPLFALLGALCAGLFAAPSSAKDTEHKHKGGPNGGRLFGQVQPHAEFLVQKDRTVAISFYDEAMKLVPVGAQTATLVAETKAGKTKIEFERKGNVLVSKGTLPEGDGYNLVLQFKQAAEAKPQNFRFKFETHDCGECRRMEYACTCDH
jgi:hypothetical protein